MTVNLFWCIDSQTQAALLMYQWNEYGEKLEIPTPPMTSKGVWLAVKLESIEEIDKLLRQAPSRSRE